MSREELLEPDETLRWEGRPAPRCYTFRNWRHALFGLLLLLLAGYWQVIGIQLAAVYDLPWLPLIPFPFVLAGLYLGPGHLLVARLEWPHVAYAVTDRRIIVRRGMGGRRRRQLPLDQVVWFRLNRHGEELGSLVVRGEDPDSRLVLCCIEHPLRVTALLESAMVRAGRECTVLEGHPGSTGNRAGPGGN